MNFFRHVPRLVAALLFAASASTAVVVADAQPARAGVVVGVRVGSPHRFWRYGYRSGRWLRSGFAYAAGPGYVHGYYLGYGPPPVAYYPAPVAYYPPPYYGPRFSAAYYGRPYYGYRWHRGWQYGRPWVRRAAYGWHR
ncbi:MAG: hypothetical protein ABSB70_23970 [Candidatus Velthaea sp.]|jgi:hypothetical protein